MTQREKARRMLAAEAVIGAIVERAVELRSELTGDVLDLYREAGSDRLTVDEGTVSLIKPDPAGKITVSDETGMTRYVQDNHPTEVVSTVRPKFRTVLLGRLTVVDGDVVDTTTGEVVPWAKHTPAADPSSISVRPNAAAKALARDLLAQRLPELTGGSPLDTHGGAE